MMGAFFKADFGRHYTIDGSSFPGLSGECKWRKSMKTTVTFLAACPLILMLGGMDVGAQDPSMENPPPESNSSGVISSGDPLIEEGVPDSSSPEEATTEEPVTVEPVIGISAERYTKVIELGKRSSETRAQIDKHEMKAKIARNDILPPELTLFDYENKMEYRLYEGDHIYFEVILQDTLFYKARREGLIPAEEREGVDVTRISLGKTVWDNHPCEIILKIRTAKRQDNLISDYTLIWEALDLEQMPVKVAYYRTNRVLVIVEYLNAHQQTFDPSYFEVPKGFLALEQY